ncbi:MAG TPA: aminotransferase class I and II, partial [Calditrichia bacterium]|nr:aminotransferase class I and II [Calditrichia bacterium]
LSKHQPDPLTASLIVWLDAFIRNIDRTVRNVNMLIQAEQLWLIDHGAGLYFHHRRWEDPAIEAQKPFPMVKDHVLLKQANELAEADQYAHEALDEQHLRELVYALPEVWLSHESSFGDPEAARKAYHDYLMIRLEGSKDFVREAGDARAQL